MSTLDLFRLRKNGGMSQRELAGHLHVRPSFLSAIENGKSRMPEEKLEKLKEIFQLDSLDEYIIEDPDDTVLPPHSHVPPHSHITTHQHVAPHSHTTEQTESITQLLNHFHDLAHLRDKSYAETEADTAARIEFLTKRNDRLSERVDDLREEIDRLREEILRLKELLIKNSIPY